MTKIINNDNKKFIHEKVLQLTSLDQKIYDNENSTDITDKQNDSNYKQQTLEKIIGNYLIEKVINKGIFSKIFLGKHIITGEYVAIKRFDKSLYKNDLQNLKRLKKELKILKTVMHENIIKLLEIIENNNKIYLITEYCPNDLYSQIIINQKLPEEQALKYFEQIINALNYLHENGIAHRNLKLDNILLTKNNTQIKLIDFGLSTFYSKDSLLSSPVGAIVYCPPEMHLSQSYSGELSDIWNAGLVLYSMLCGYLPFHDDNEDINIKHIISGFYQIPSFISEKCAEVIKKCLEIDPCKRICFKELINLKWIKNDKFSYTKGIERYYNKIPIDYIILNECKKYLGNYNISENILKIKESVENNLFNEYSSLYYLVSQKLNYSNNNKKSFISVDNNNDSSNIIIGNIKIKSDEIKFKPIYNSINSPYKSKYVKAKQIALSHNNSYNNKAYKKSFKKKYLLNTSISKKVISRINTCNNNNFSISSSSNSNMKNYKSVVDSGRREKYKSFVKNEIKITNQEIIYKIKRPIQYSQDKKFHITINEANSKKNNNIIYFKHILSHSKSSENDLKDNDKANLPIYNNYQNENENLNQKNDIENIFNEDKPILHFNTTINKRIERKYTNDYFYSNYTINNTTTDNKNKENPKDFNEYQQVNKLLKNLKKNSPNNSDDNNSFKSNYKKHIISNSEKLNNIFSYDKINNKKYKKIKVSKINTQRNYITRNTQTKHTNENQKFSKTLIDYIKNKDINKYVFVKRNSFIKSNKNNFNNIINDINENKEEIKIKDKKQIDIDCYNENIIDISCVKYCNFKKLIKKINTALKMNKVNYNITKETLFHCWKYDKFFEIEIFYLRSGDKLENKGRKITCNFNENNSYYLKIRSRKGNIKGFLSNFFRDILD